MTDTLAVALSNILMLKKDLTGIPVGIAVQIGITKTAIRLKDDLCTKITNDHEMNTIAAGAQALLDVIPTTVVSENVGLNMTTTREITENTTRGDNDLLFLLFICI